MTADKFFERCDMDGTDYTLVDYYSQEDLDSIENHELRIWATEARKALVRIQQIRDELSIEFI